MVKTVEHRGILGHDKGHIYNVNDVNNINTSDIVDALMCFIKGKDHVIRYSCKRIRKSKARYQ